MQPGRSLFVLLNASIHNYMGKAFGAQNCLHLDLFITGELTQGFVFHITAQTI